MVYSRQDVLPGVPPSSAPGTGPGALLYPMLAIPYLSRVRSLSMGDQTTVWFRNPDNYIKELVEVGVPRIVWDRGFLIKRSINPVKHAELYYPVGTEWRMMILGPQGTVELRPGYTMEKPFAVYSTWEYGQELTELEELCASDIGQDLNACTDTSVPVDERPIYNQPHIVVVTDIPSANTGPGRQMLRHIQELQEDYPECTLHVHGLYGFRPIFGMGYKSVDWEARTTAQKGKVMLPSGKEVKYEHTKVMHQWITLLGFKPVDLDEPRNRCMYNIKSALWAGEHYRENFSFKVQGAHNPQPDATSVVPATTVAHFSNQTLVQAGDKIHCDSCSLILSCKYYREGSVCSLPNSEPAKLVKVFGTRDSSQIIDGLNGLMQIGTRRLEQGLEAEEMEGELDPEVTKIVNQLFQQGVKLAKLVDPTLTKPGLQINLPGSHQTAIVAQNSGQLVAAIVAQFEAQGIKREEITPAMIEHVMIEQSNQSQVIDV